MPQELGRFTIKQRETQHVFTDPVNEGKSTGKTRSSDAAEGNEEGSVGFFSPSGGDVSLVEEKRRGWFRLLCCIGLRR